jgi:hypothetical protein
MFRAATMASLESPRATTLFVFSPDYVQHSTTFL